MDRKVRIRNRLLHQLVPAIPPCVCVDVGASYYPPAAWSLFFKSPQTSIISVEPNFKNLQYLKDWKYPAKVEGFEKGLSMNGGPRTLYVTASDSGSSLYPPVLHSSFAHRGIEPSYFFPVKEMNVQTATLEEILAKQKNKLPVVIKLDTQGTELEILHGGLKRIVDHQVVGLEIETPLLAVPVMQGSSRFWEANRDLESWGFELLEIKPFFSSSIYKTKKIIGKRAAWECDAVFALRRDVAQKLHESFRQMLFYFYLAYEFYEEALSFISSDKQIKRSLEEKLGNNPVILLKKILEISD